MGLSLLRFKFNTFLWLIVTGMILMIVSFIIFMTLINNASKKK